MQRTRYPDCPRRIAEVAFELAEDRRDRVGGEVDAALGLETFNGADECEPATWIRSSMDGPRLGNCRARREAIGRWGSMMAALHPKSSETQWLSIQPMRNLATPSTVGKRVEHMPSRCAFARTVDAEADLRVRSVLVAP